MRSPLFSPLHLCSFVNLGHGNTTSKLKVRNLWGQTVLGWPLSSHVKWVFSEPRPMAAKCQAMMFSISRCVDRIMRWCVEGVWLAQIRGSEIICHHYIYSGGHTASRLFLLMISPILERLPFWRLGPCRETERKGWGGCSHCEERGTPPHAWALLARRRERQSFPEVLHAGLGVRDRTHLWLVPWTEMLMGEM